GVVQRKKHCQTWRGTHAPMCHPMWTACPSSGSLGAGGVWACRCCVDARASRGTRLAEQSPGAERGARGWQKSRYAYLYRGKSLRLRSGEALARGTDRQGGVQDAFLLPQVIGELLDLHRRSANEDHFGAQVVVEVHMGSSQDGVIVVVLQLD